MTAACWPLFDAEEATRCGECETLWGPSRVCPGPRSAVKPVPQRAMVSLPVDWHDTCITRDEVTGCWLWDHSLIPPTVARKLIAARTGAAGAGRQECEREQCVNPLHAGPIKSMGVGS